MSNTLFQPASRHQLKARIALDGPTGSGKSWTGLAMARELAGPDGRIGAIDTERGSLELYSDLFDFDVLKWVPPYDPRKLAQVLKDTEGDFDVMFVDSMTHFWKGEGGTLDIVTAAGARQGGNNYAGWNVGTPALRSLIDTVLGLDTHVICTMRSKMEHVLQEDERGRQVPVKIGMSPEMRGDIEYEFTLCMSMDLNHRGVVTKSRCTALADAMMPAGTTHVAELTSVFHDWLRNGSPPPTLVDEARRARLIDWANSLRGSGQASELRELWPVGVPPLRDPNLTEAHAERIQSLLAAIAPEPTKTLEAAAAEVATTSGEAPVDAGEPSPAQVELDAMADEVQAHHGGDPTPPAPEPAPELPVAPADDSPAPDGGEPATDGTPGFMGGDIDWKVEGATMGLGSAAVLTTIRDLASEMGFDEPPSVRRAPMDPAFQEALFTRLANLGAAKKAREAAE